MVETRGLFSWCELVLLRPPTVSLYLYLVSVLIGSNQFDR